VAAACSCDARAARNKRDLLRVLDADTLRKEPQRKNGPVFEAVAKKGAGVFETPKTSRKFVLNVLRKQ
jgi:mutual gliding-motility protein MglA